MRTINDPIQGPAIIRVDTRVNGVVSGDLTVPKDVKLELNGTVTGNLLVCPGATAIIYGQVRGRVFNEGTAVSIYGEVGSLREHESGAAFVHPMAVIRDAVEQARKRA